MQTPKTAPERSLWEEATGKKVHVAFYHRHQPLANTIVDAQPPVPQPSRKRGRSPDEDGEDERLVSPRLRAFSNLLTVTLATSPTKWRR